MEVTGQLHISAALLLMKELPVHFGQESVGPQNWFERELLGGPPRSLVTIPTEPTGLVLLANLYKFMVRS
jgi:hypothetical protein